MSLFINNILSRHLNQQSNVQPRLPGKFEPVQFAPTNAPEIFAAESAAETIPAAGTSKQSLQTGNETIGSDNGIAAIAPTVQQANLNVAAPQNIFKAMHTSEWLTENKQEVNENAATTMAEKMPGEKKEHIQALSEPGKSGDQELTFPLNTRALQTDSLKDPALNTVSSIRATSVAGLMNNPVIEPETGTEYDELLNRNLTQLRQKIKKNQPGKKGNNIYQTPASEINNSMQPSVNLQLQMKAAAASVTVGEQVVNSVVKISIGRIDVRAVTTPSPVKVAKSQPQKLNLTLDDYLKKRNGNLK